MSIQAITTPPVALPNLLQPEADPSASSQKDSDGESSGITIKRVDKQAYPDGYVVTTTTYANKTSTTQTAPRSAPPPLARSGFDPSNGGQLSTLLSAQEQTSAQAPVAVGINPYAR